MQIFYNLWCLVEIIYKKKKENPDSIDHGDYCYAGQVIKAWDIGVATMRVGEVSQFICKPEYAYGAAGSPPKIPPNATLVFEVSANQ